MKAARILISLLLAVLHGPISVVLADSDSSEDVVMIVSVTPDSATSGEEIEATIKVAYNLVSHDSGAVRITANTLAPNGDHIIASRAISRGAGELILKATFTPRYWSDTVATGINAALLVPAGDDLRTKALSVDRVNLQVKTERAGSAGDLLPDFSKIYVDGVSIISISPDSFEEGEDQEIVVKVAYELLSREEGLISVSINGDRPAARREVARKRVELGKGEAEIRTSITAKKTAGLPFGRVLVTLCEFPRAKRSRPLAWDEATIGVD